MKLISSGIFLTFFFFGALSSAAQSPTSPVNMNYIPPSPNAASLGKFGDIPVSLYTGIPSISVPIYSYKGSTNGLSLNVSLDYHAGGIRVEEIGSSVGLGWALNAGGVISRTVRGIPDEYPTYGYMALSPLQMPNTDDTAASAPVMDFVQNDEDSEEDVFTYNFNGHTGKFILNGQGNPILVTQETIQIQSIFGTPPEGGLPLLGFWVRDQNGVKYLFLNRETTTTNLGPTAVLPFASSWYLTDIISPFNSDTIKFTYDSAYQNYQNLGMQTRQNYLYNGTTTVNAQSTTTTNVETYTEVLGLKLKSIILPNDVQLHFTYAPEARCDLNGDSILSSINIVDALTGVSRGYQLYQSYMIGGMTEATNPPPCDTSSTTSSTDMRLELDSVKEFTGSTLLTPYVFQYNNQYSLPPTNSMQQDFWGYNNSTLDTATTLVPEYLWNDYDNNISYWLDGADRRPDSNAVKAGSLSQITYPTGGYTQFKYSVNRAGDGKLIFNGINNNDVSFGYNNNDTTSGSTTFTINRQPSNTTENFIFNLNTWCPGVSTNAEFLFTITSVDGTVTYASQTMGYSSVSNPVTVSVSGMPNGQYMLNWSFTGPLAPECVCEDNFNFQLTWQDPSADSAQLAGGLRIDSVIDYDGVSHSNDQITSYQYIDSAGNSSGYTGGLVNYGYDYSNCTSQYDPYSELTVITINDYFTRTATTNTPLSFTSGSSVGYSRVVVTKRGPLNVGKEIDYFTSYADAPAFSPGGMTTAFPFVPLQVQDWYLGKLTRQELYDSSGNLMKKTIHNYVDVMTNLNDTLLNFKVGIITQNTCGAMPGEEEGGGGGATFTNTYNGTPYYWSTGYSQETSMATTEYTISGDSMTQTAYFTYDPVYFENVTQETTLDSKGDTVEVRHYYPFDYSIPGSPFSAMVDSNIIAPPVSNETWKYLNGQYYLTKADATNYSTYFNGIFPSSLYTTNSSSPISVSEMGTFNSNALLRVPSLYDDDVDFQSYSASGVPLQVNKRGARTNYLWDINHQFPVARIDNADTADVAYTSFEADGTGNWTVPSGYTNSSEAMTGTKSYNLTSGYPVIKSGLNSSMTYVVSYWSTNGPMNVNGTADTVGTVVTQPGGPTWTYYEHKVTGATTISISGNGAIDELRLFPLGSLMTTYTYTPLLGMTSECTPSNYVTYYNYDGFGRLVNVKDLRGNILRTYHYHYKGQ